MSAFCYRFLGELSLHLVVKTYFFGSSAFLSLEVFGWINTETQALINHVSTQVYNRKHAIIAKPKIKG